MSGVRRTFIYLSLAVNLGGAGCVMSKDSAGLANDDFRLWCGDRACAWSVDEGEVERVPTWHRSVYGIGLVSDPSQISQVVEMENVQCLLLSILADVDDKAILYWKVDFDNDGFDDRDHGVEVDARDWKTAYREAGVPAGCTEARIIIRKTGRGRAVVAKAEISGDAYCAANPEPGSTASATDSETMADCEPDGGQCEE